MKRLLLLSTLIVLVGVLSVGWSVTAAGPPSPVVAAQPSVPVAYPGSLIAFDQPKGTDPAPVVNTMAWDAGAKADIPETACTPFGTEQRTCTIVVPSTIGGGTHTLNLTAYQIINGTRYESAVVAFAFSYVIPAAPPAPTGCRIIIKG